MRLVHLDMSGLGIKMEGLLYIAKHGIRKSRTLQSIHLSGMVADKTPIKQALRVEEMSEIAKIDPKVLEELFRFEDPA